MLELLGRGAHQASRLGMTNDEPATITRRARAGGPGEDGQDHDGGQHHTATGSSPHEATSTISTKAHEKLPSDEMTSPAGWSMCQR